MLKSRNLVQPEDFSIKEIDEILDLAQQIMANPANILKFVRENY